MEKIMILMFLGGISGVLSQTDMSGKSFIFHKNYSLPAQLQYHGEGPGSALAVCLRACARMTESVMFSLIGALPHDYLFLVLGSGLDSNAGLVWLDGQKEDVTFPATRERQRSVCLSWDSANGKLDLWVDGRISARREYPMIGVSYDKPSINLGPGQIFLGGRPRMEAGEVTDLHVWDRLLRPREVADYHQKKDVVGNIINWRALNYRRGGGDFTVGKFKCKAKPHKSKSP